MQVDLEFKTKSIDKSGPFKLEKDVRRLNSRRLMLGVDQPSIEIQRWSRWVHSTESNHEFDLDILKKYEN